MPKYRVYLEAPTYTMVANTPKEAVERALRLCREELRYSVWELKEGIHPIDALLQEEFKDD